MWAGCVMPRKVPENPAYLNGARQAVSGAVRGEQTAALALRLGLTQGAPEAQSPRSYWATEGLKRTTSCKEDRL